MKRDRAYDPTWVYVMTMSGRTKIGISTDLAKRKRQLANASGVDVVLRSSREFAGLASAKVVEGALHRKFGRHRLNGEWFNVDAHLVALALQAAVDPHHPDDKPIEL